MRGSLKNLLLRSRKSIVLIVVTALSTLVLSGLISVWLARYDINLPSVARIKAIAVEVYWDQNLKNKTEKIDWGTVYVGSRNNITLYILSTSSERTNLTMKPENWVFTYANGTSSDPTNDTQHVKLYWDCEGEELEPGQNTTAIFTLYVNSSIDTFKFIVQNEIKSFSFDIRIQPKELT